MSNKYLSEQDNEILEMIENGEILGGCLNTVDETELNPTYEEAEAEVVYPSKRKQKSGMNARIIFGKDRLGGLAAGFGGNGAPASNAIDIVVGLASSYRKLGRRVGKETVVSPNPYTDAARIYISQRTNISARFGVTEGEQYEIDRPGKEGGGGVSAVGVKADTVLVVGRRNVKIKAGRCVGTNLPQKGETDAHGRPISSDENRIELIGATGASLEPLVLGDKLASYLKTQAEAINKINTQIQGILLDIATLKIQLVAHVHGDPISGITLPSPDLAVGLISDLPQDLQNQLYSYMETLNGTINELNALEVPNQTNYILSKNVFTT
mgnify:CR=1 FL=1